MYVEVIKDYVAILGRRGERRDIPDDEAKVHIALGNVKKVVTLTGKPARKKRSRRVYRRRDMQAETPEGPPNELVSSGGETKPKPTEPVTPIDPPVIEDPPADAKPDDED